MTQLRLRRFFVPFFRLFLRIQTRSASTVTGNKVRAGTRRGCHHKPIRFNSVLLCTDCEYVRRGGFIFYHEWRTFLHGKHSWSTVTVYNLKPVLVLGNRCLVLLVLL